MQILTDIQLCNTRKFTAIFEQMKTNSRSSLSAKLKELLIYNRWPWHVAFWIGYIIFRFGVYYITVQFYPAVYLEYMLLSEVMFAAVTYFTLWLYRKLFQQEKFMAYFLVGTAAWIGYLYGRTLFQFSYLENAPGFKSMSFSDMLINNITIVIVYFLFITTCKYFKDGFIAQQFESVRKEEQLRAEVNNLKSQIAPHFLFNTLNNLYGLAVDKSDKVPELMLRLSDILRHSLYETQKSAVPLHEELAVLKSYIELERIRLESNVQLVFNNTVPAQSPYEIAPLILIVFVENAFKHAKYVQGQPVHISIDTSLEKNWFNFTIKNNYNQEDAGSLNGIGLVNVKRRLEVLYPHHQLQINKADQFYKVALGLPLSKSTTNDV